MKKILVALLCAGLAACASAPRPSSPTSSAPAVQAPRDVASGRDCSWYQPAEEDLSKRGDYVAGGLYRPEEKDRVPTGAIPDIDCDASRRPKNRAGRIPSPMPKPAHRDATR